MIKIDKPNTSPTILTTKGAERTQNDCDAFDNSPDDYRSREKKFKFNQDFYGDPEVRDALLKAQNGKCCYCEKLIDVGEVEHFRPKGAVKQAHGQSKQSPGYYWLVYAWDNLFLSCHECNSKKGILFPLQDDTVRARSHHNDIDDEQPLFINPTEEPSDHIGFREHVPVPITSRGRETIKGLGLRRYGLEEKRRRYLDNLCLYRDFVETANDFQDPDVRVLVIKAQDFLQTATLPAAEYSAMARAFLAT